MSPIIKKDSFWFGITAGLLLPVVVYGILLLIYLLMDSMGIFSDVGYAEDFRFRTLGLFSICANLVLMNRYRKTYHYETIRGILLASMLLVGIWFWIFGLKILQA